MAFKRGTTWSVVAMNNAAPGSAPVGLRITLPGSGTIRSTGAFRTTVTKDLAPTAPSRYRRGAVVRVPSQSLTTYTFSDA